MASHPTYADHHHVETDSGAFFKVAAVLLGIAVGIVGFFALMLWSDARNARATRPPRLRSRRLTSTPEPCR